MIANERFEETAQNIRNIKGATNTEPLNDEAKVTHNDETKVRLANAIKQIKQQKIGASVSLPIYIIDLSKNLRLEVIDENDPEFIQLVESIKEIGLIHKPVITTDDECIFPLEGHRRITALKYLGHDTVSCEIRILEKEELNHLTSLIANTARKNWNILAVANSLQLLYQKNYTQEKLAQLLGKDRTTIIRLLKIASWPLDAHELILNNSDKITSKALLNMASKTLSHEQIRNQLKDLCGLLPPKESDNNISRKQEKNTSKFEDYIKTKKYSPDESNIVREALLEFGFLK